MLCGLWIHREPAQEGRLPGVRGAVLHEGQCAKAEGPVSQTGILQAHGYPSNNTEAGILQKDGEREETTMWVAVHLPFPELQNDQSKVSPSLGDFTDYLVQPKVLPRLLSGKNSTCQNRRQGFDPWVGKIRWRRKWQPTPVFLPGKSHGQRSLVSYSPWSRKSFRHN